MSVMADDTPASLATLPVELTTHICTLLLAASPKASLAPLALTSKSLHSAVEPLLYTDVTLEHPEIHLLPLADRLLRSPARALAVTRLRIAPTGPTPPVADDDLASWRAKAPTSRRRGWPAAPDLPALLSSALRAAAVPAEQHATLYAAIRYGARPDVLVALLLTHTPNLRVLALGMLGAAPAERLTRRVPGCAGRVRETPNYRDRRWVPPPAEALDVRAERLLWRPVLAGAVARLGGVRALFFGGVGRVDSDGNGDGDGDVEGRSCAALAQLLQLRGLRLVLLAAVAAVPWSAAREEAKGALAGLPAGSCDARKVLLFECWGLDDACEEALRRACGRLDVLLRLVQGDRAAHGLDVAAAFDEALPLRMEGEWPLLAGGDVLDE